MRFAIPIPINVCHPGSASQSLTKASHEKSNRASLPDRPNLTSARVPVTGTRLWGVGGAPAPPTGERMEVESSRRDDEPMLPAPVCAQLQHSPVAIH